MYFKKNFIVKNEKINDKKTEIIFRTENSKSFELTIFLRPNIDTAPNVGIDNKKEILAESTLLNSKSLAAEIVIPDLLTPGIRDKTWKNPIKIADL